LRSCPETALPSFAGRNPFSRVGLPQRLVAIALVSLVGFGTVGGTGCTNMPIQSSGGFGPSGAQVTAAAIGVGAAVVGVAVLVHHSNHTRKGCILSGPNGLEVQVSGDSNLLDLTGVTADAKAGDVYRLHGSMAKRAKNAAGNRTFVVEKVGRDFGPCPVKAPVVASSR
jgi:hypothetical protein